MDQNTTPSSCRNRGSSSGTPQENPNLGFQQYQGGYQPQTGFHQFHGGYQPQTGDSFWVRAENVFYSFIGRGGYRTRHQLNTKFKDLNKKITRFAGIYNNLVNTRPSGASDADILKMAQARYEMDVGTAFVHGDAWEILKVAPKWSQVPTFSSASSRASKRSKTSGSSDAGCNFNVVDDDDEEDDAVEPFQRPIGRDKARKASKSNAAEMDPGFLASVSEFTTQISDKKEYKKKKLELQKEKLANEKKMLEIEQQRLDLQRHLQFEKDLEFYISPIDHLTGSELRAALVKKENIKRFHNFDF